MTPIGALKSLGASGASMVKCFTSKYGAVGINIDISLLSMKESRKLTGKMDNFTLKGNIVCAHFLASLLY